MKKHTHLADAVLAIATTLSIAAFAPLPFATSSLEARIIERPTVANTWKTLTEVDVESGATVVAGMNTFFHLPTSVDTIDREVLLGKRGYTTRYWGYCLPGENDPENLRQTVGFPGKLFLSEAERAHRKAEEERQNRFSIFQPPSSIPVRSAASVVRHQLEIFRGGMTCFVMTEKELALGIDKDDDGLNSRLESHHQTDPMKPDTDGDGINDGLEVNWGTNPTRRDTDGDGIIDGIEDANQNARLDPGETDPRQRDTDGDGMCDGLCREYRTRKVCRDNIGRDCTEVPYGSQMGEDRNLNGKVEKGETDPRKKDTDEDGIPDDIQYFRCIASGAKNC